MERKESIGLKIITDFGAFAQFHAITSQKLGDLKTEDEKLKLLEMLKFIYQNVLDEVLHKAVNESLFNPCLGHLISTLISLAVNDKYFKIKNEVIEIIGVIIDRYNGYYQKIKKGFNPSDLLASFLPGICQFLMKMITKDEKQNKIVYINSLKTLSSLFVCVYHDYEDGLTEKSKNFPFLMPRTKEWRLNSVKKLNIIIELIERAILNHPSVQVKEALINFVTIIVFHIVDYQENHDLLPIIGQNLFKIPLTLIYDENESVRNLSLSFTQLVITKFHNSQNFTLEEQLMDDLLKLLDNFEKELTVYSEENILRNLKLLCGYLNCFNQIEFNMVMSNQSEKFFSLLSLIFRLDLNRMSANVLPKEQTEFTNIDFFEKKYNYFETNQMLKQLDILCELVKRLSDTNLLNDHVLKSLSDDNLDFSNKANDETSKNKSTNLLVISHLVKRFDSNSINLHMINKCIDLLENEINQIDDENLCIDERFESTIFCAILLEVITNFAYAISEQEQQQYFITTLYTIMSCTGSTHLQIQINAKASIAKLVHIFNYNSIKEMITGNLDHILSKMQIKLNNFNDKQNLYFVFKIMFDFVDADICYSFEQTIDNLLIAMDANYSIVNFERLAKVLSLIVKIFKRWFVNKATKDAKNLKSNKIEVFSNDLIDFLKKRAEDKKNLEILEQELKSTDVDENSILEEQKRIEEEQIKNELKEEDDTSKNLPAHIDFTKKILERCSNFLSYNVIQVRLLILDIMIDGLDVLKSHEDSLLPTAHVIWESLVHRFKDEPIVLFKCTECLIRLAVTCGDFIRSRTIKQVLPQIYSFLKITSKQSLLSQIDDRQPAYTSSTLSTDGELEESKDSKNGECILSESSKQSVKNSSNAFFYSLDYRLQQLLLEQLGRLAFNIKLCRKELWPLIVIIIQYLDVKQPIELRTAAYSSLRELEQLDNYAVYFYQNYFFINSDSVYYRFKK